MYFLFLPAFAEFLYSYTMDIKHNSCCYSNTDHEQIRNICLIPNISVVLVQNYKNPRKGLQFPKWDEQSSSRRKIKSQNPPQNIYCDEKEVYTRLLFLF